MQVSKMSVNADSPRCKCCKYQCGTPQHNWIPPSEYVVTKKCYIAILPIWVLFLQLPKLLSASILEISNALLSNKSTPGQTTLLSEVKKHKWHTWSSPTLIMMALLKRRAPPPPSTSSKNKQTKQTNKQTDKQTNKQQQQPFKTTCGIQAKTHPSPRRAAPSCTEKCFTNVVPCGISTSSL